MRLDNVGALGAIRTAEMQMEDNELVPIAQTVANVTAQSDKIEYLRAQGIPTDSLTILETNARTLDQHSTTEWIATFVSKSVNCINKVISAG